MPTIALEADKRLNAVFVGAFGDTLSLPIGEYDCVVFNDVLEHMVDPAGALGYARTLLKPAGCIVASIPNIRHFPTVWKLVVHGRWEYAEAGTLDRTHLRFFTKESIKNLFREAGYTITQLTGINRYAVNSKDEYKLWRYFKIIQKLAPHRLEDMAYLQFAVVAFPRVSS